MATMRGREDVRRFIRDLPDQLRDSVLRGAARAGGRLVMDEAKSRCVSDTVREAIVLRTKADAASIAVYVTIKGRWPLAVANWLEYGTTKHLIKVNDSVRAGRSVGRINRQDREGSLKIGANFVGQSVEHPGAGRREFLRVSLDIREAEAIGAAQRYINARITRAGIIGGNDQGGDE